ncbi:hypothetical protein [Paraburkholderia tagetis]|uniref:hypothetical protein n=1 Tax=Paraburkholderia tagetis TaxID=2913261 RepID=UPI001EE45634|nr:hypothetical protein [Paraburkholderia tagetis]
MANSVRGDSVSCMIAVTSKRGRRASKDKPRVIETPQDIESTGRQEEELNRPGISGGSTS